MCVCTPSRADILLIHQLRVATSYTERLRDELLRVSAEHERARIREAIARLEASDAASAPVSCV